jgi:Double zinc ribbon
VTLASFISSGTSHAVLNGLEFFAVVLWLSLGYWTYKDARRRIADPLLVGLATLLGLGIPFIGPFIYMLFRPPEYLEDVRERELEIKAIEERINAVDLRCPVCHAEVDASYLVCPVCTTKLKQACVSCGSPLDPIWQVCPYCETPIEPAVPGTPPALGTRRAQRRSVKR